MFMFLILLLVLSCIFGGWRGGLGWSPLGIIIAVFIFLYFFGYIDTGMSVHHHFRRW